ncbi:hypothetical protein [Glycomyces sp. NPDC048151]|uniref:hypothetical protein n=1 Tax=Glycomyces sp. NPDC048151 TaxID=3364002 RepID=UPI003714BD95
MAWKRAPGTPSSQLATPAIRKLLLGRKLEYKARGHADRPIFDKGSNNNLAIPNKPTYNPATKKWTLHVQRHEGWNAKDYRKKTDAMIKAGRDGKLKYVKNTKPERKGAQGKKRDLQEEKAIRKAIKMEDRGNVEGAQKYLDKRLRTLDTQEADHIRELQIGGKDLLHNNLRMIDAETNNGMGSQLRSQIVQATNMGMKNGDLIEIVELPGIRRNI